MSEYKVSVVIPTKDRVDYLKRCIESMQNQTVAPDEIIVVDDSHGKSAEAFCSRLNAEDKRVSYFHSNGAGANKARNIGIQNSTCPVIAFCDDDDYFEKDNLQKQLLTMRESNVKVVYCGSYRIKIANGKIINRKTYLPPFPPQKLMHRVLLSYNFIGTQVLMAQKDALLKVGCFDEELKKMQDWDLVIRLSKEFRFGCTRLPLVNIYEHDKGRISDLSGNFISFIFKKHKTDAKNLLTAFLIFLYSIRQKNKTIIFNYLKNVWFN